ncbi:MAG: amino acid ABC transporter permease, partial [Cyanobium sp. MAG_160]|nr:amino acid ABC transporter permease [Cyanobium sp. MAG_160]
MPPWWRNRRYLPWLVQGAVALLIAVVVAFLLTNLLLNLTARGLLLSWSWLGQPAGFDLAETILPFDASLPYWRAMLAGLVNTLRVVIAGLVGATLLGTLIGTASFSSNGLLRGLARV